MRMKSDWVNLACIALFAILIFFYGKAQWKCGATERDTHLTIKYENRQVELYNNLKAVGIEMSPEQQKEFENLIKKQHRPIGFK